MSRLLGVDELFYRTSVKPNTWRTWISRGKLKTVKLGRRRLVPLEELERLITEGTVAAREEGA